MHKQKKHVMHHFLLRLYAGRGRAEEQVCNVLVHGIVHDFGAQITVAVRLSDLELVQGFIY